MKLVVGLGLDDLVKRADLHPPVPEEETQADGLEGAGGGADEDGVEGSLFGEDLGDELYDYKSD